MPGRAGPASLGAAIVVGLVLLERLSGSPGTLVGEFVRPGDVALVKGSFAINMGHVVERLLAAETRRRTVNG